MKKILKGMRKLLLILLCIVFILLSVTTIYHHVSLGNEVNNIIPNGMLVEVDGHKIHIYAEGEKGDKPTLVFMSGSGTVAPVYDFKALYSMLSDEYRIAVVEKAGYGYSEICEVERILTLCAEVRQGWLLREKADHMYCFPIPCLVWKLFIAQLYPEELTAIIGLDMAVPKVMSTSIFKHQPINVYRRYLFGWGYTGYQCLLSL